jgi:putative transposase
MKRSRFTQERTIGVVKEHQAGATAAELCRKHGISDATFYTWRSKYGGMEVSDARKLKGLEDDNARLTVECREPGDPGESLFATSRLRPGGHGAADLPLRVAAAR